VSYEVSSPKDSGLDKTSIHRFLATAASSLLLLAAPATSIPLSSYCISAADVEPEQKKSHPAVQPASMGEFVNGKLFCVVMAGLDRLSLLLETSEIPLAGVRAALYEYANT
jgi:hypothetical protein